MIQCTLPGLRPPKEFTGKGFAVGETPRSFSNQESTKTHGSHACNPSLFTAFTVLAQDLLAGKKHHKRRPKTAAKFVVDEWLSLTFKPQLLSSPFGWQLGDHIRLELRSRLKKKSAKEPGCKVILDMLPDGRISTRKCPGDPEQARKLSALIGSFLDLLARDPATAFRRNTAYCPFCGKGYSLNDTSAQWRGYCSNCQESADILFRHIGKNLNLQLEVNRYEC